MNRARSLILVVIAGALALLLWKALVPPETRSEMVDAKRATLAPPNIETQSSLSTVKEASSERAAAAAGRPREVLAQGVSADLEREQASRSTGSSAGPIPLRVSFVRAGGRAAYPATGELLLEPVPGDAAAAAGVARKPFSIPLHGGSSVVQKVASGPWRLHVVGEDFRHVPETVIVAPTSHCLLTHKVTLWSEKEIPVRMQTPDGRPVWNFAEDLGWTKANLLYKAFEFRCSAQPISAPSPNGTLTEVGFKRPYGSGATVCVGDDLVGHVLRVSAASRWLGLWVHGRFQSEQFVDPDSTELLYVLTLDDLIAPSGSVTLTVVDRETKLPLETEVRATLDARSVSLRRDDLQNRTPLKSGEIAFEKVVPGIYDLTVVRKDNVALREVELVSGQDLNLGVIELGNDLPLMIRITTEDGRPIPAYIEVANYVRGASADELYGHKPYRYTDNDRTYALPIPDRPCIVRARQEIAFDQEPTLLTMNVLVDPSALPPVLDIVARTPQAVEISVETPWEKGHALEVREKALDLTVHRSRRQRQVVGLQLGSYVTRHLGTSGELLGEQTIDVTQWTSAISVR